MRPPRSGGGFGGHGSDFCDKGPPAEVVKASAFMHACEGDAVAKLANEKVPFFNAPIYLQNKTQIGKVNEIFGPINDYCFFIKMMEGIIATSYPKGDKFYIDPAKLLPLTRFLAQTKDMHKLQLRGAPRGGRDGPPRGGGRGGFRGRGRS